MDSGLSSFTNNVPMIENFNDTIDIWINSLDQYTFTQLYSKPSVKEWSIGQVYFHLIEDTNHYISQIRICISSNDNALEEPSPMAKTMLLNNDFPDERLKGAHPHDAIVLPHDMDYLRNELVRIKQEMNIVAELISKSEFNGKTKHPGFHYLNASEWFQFAEMHFRHHLRQKKRIDDYLIYHTYFP